MRRRNFAHLKASAFLTRSIPVNETFAIQQKRFRNDSAKRGILIFAQQMKDNLRRVVSSFFFDLFPHGGKRNRSRERVGISLCADQTRAE